MFIKSITLYNFQCYYGENKIEFSKGLNLILGANGFGKSKLYDAFQWLFDTEEVFLKKFQKIGEVKSNFVCDKAKEEALLDESIECFVEIEVEHTSKIYKLKRTYKIKKVGVNQFNEPLKSVTQASYYDVLAFKPCQETFKDIIEKLIPEETRPYVWFQGESGVNHLINTADAKSLKKVIQQLSSISMWDEFETVANTTATTADDKLSSLRKTSGVINTRVNNFQIQLDQVRISIKQKEAYIETDKITVASAQEIQDKYITQLTDAKEIYTLRKDLEIAKKDYERGKKIWEDKTDKFTAQIFEQHWVLFRLQNYVGKFGEKLSEYDHEKRSIKERITGEKAKFYLPANVPDPLYLAEMLEKGFCYVCNQKVEVGTEAYHFIEAKLQDKNTLQNTALPLNDHHDFFTKLRNNAIKLEDKIINIPTNVQAYQEAIQEAKQQEEEEYKKVLDIQNKLDKLIQTSGIENADIITDTYQNAQKQGDIAERNILKNELALAESYKEVKRIEGELKSLTKDNKDIALAESIKEMAQSVKEIVADTKSRVYQEFITQLERKANEHFTRINDIAGAFVGNIVFKPQNNGYSPRIMNHDVDVTSTTNTSNISAMKLSIILAVISAKEQVRATELYPLITDAPVSDFDIAKTKAFLCEVGNTFAQSIIIFKEFLSQNNQAQKPQEAYSIDDKALEDLRNILNPLVPINVYRLVVMNDTSNDVNDRANIYTKIQKVTDL